MALGWALLVACAGSAVAHQFWLSVSDHAPRPGEPVVVGALSGTGFRGEARPWSNDRCVEFSWNTGHRTALAPLARDGETRWATRAFADTAGGWVQYQSTFASIELPPDEGLRHSRCFAIRRDPEIRNGSARTAAAASGIAARGDFAVGSVDVDLVIADRHIEFAVGAPFEDEHAEGEEDDEQVEPVDRAQEFPDVH